MDLFDYLEQLEHPAPKPAAAEKMRAAEDAAEVEPSVAASSPPPVAPAQPALTRDERVRLLDEIGREIALCETCRLCAGRTHTVPGEGHPTAELMFIGEAPGYHEDQQGRPFVGRSGELLTKMIEAMGWRRDEVFIGNVAKCRPPDNRKPLPDEMAACLPYLRRQIEILRPRVIVALGKTALEGLLSYTERIGITRLRGQWHDYEGIPVMPTYHPAYLLRSPDKKRETWDDLKQVMARFGKAPRAKDARGN